jgi:hypothetical protein
VTAASGKNEAQRIIGKALRRFAFERDLEGPYVIADYVIAWAKENEWDGPVAHRSTIADYFRGKAFPSRDFIALFTVALELTASEESELARVFTYPFPLAA